MEPAELNQCRGPGSMKPPGAGQRQVRPGGRDAGFVTVRGRRLGGPCAIRWRNRSPAERPDTHDRKVLPSLPQRKLGPGDLDLRDGRPIRGGGAHVHRFRRASKADAVNEVSAPSIGTLDPSCRTKVLVTWNSARAGNRACALCHVRRRDRELRAMRHPSVRGARSCAAPPLRKFPMDACRLALNSEKSSAQGSLHLVL